MRTTRLAFALGFLLLSADALCAQQPERSAVLVTPSVGFATIPRGGLLESGGLTLLLEAQVVRDGWGWGGYATARGFGVACSDGCDRGGQSLGVQMSRSRGDLTIGGGMGALHRADGWHVQPHGHLSLARGRFVVQLRVEAPADTEGLHIPLLVGMPLR